MLNAWMAAEPSDPCPCTNVCKVKRSAAEVDSVSQVTLAIENHPNGWPTTPDAAIGPAGWL